MRELSGDGFDGFVSFDELRDGALEDVPTVGGIYVVLRESKSDPGDSVDPPDLASPDSRPKLSPRVRIVQLVDCAKA